MNLHDLLDAPRALHRPGVLDGAMGTQLAERGVEPGSLACLLHPEAVLAVHRGYVAAGCDALLSNTFSATRLYTESHGVSADPAELNRAGVRLARQAADGVLVLGDMSSTGQMLEPYGSFTEAQFDETFREQAQWLAEAGVDGFMVETMTDLREARCAVRACRAAGLPVVASMSFATLKDGGRTMMGHKASDCAAGLEDEGAAAFGVNCGDLDPVEVSQVIAEARRHTRLPLVAQPNAGRPRLVEGRAVFDLTPERFAEGARRCVEAGASVVGGCCGTTPAHIRALRAVLTSL